MRDNQLKITSTKNGELVAKKPNSNLNNCKDFAKLFFGESGRFACLAGQIRKEAAQSSSGRVILTNFDFLA